MVWIYLIVQAVGFGIIAWCFKVEDKDGYAATFRIGGLLSLFLVVVAAPLPVKLLTGLLIVLFRSRINLAFVGDQEAILSCCRMSLQTLTALGSTCLDPVSRLMPDPLTRVLTHPVFCWRQEERTSNAKHPHMNIIDVEAEAIEVPHWF
ncbi:MAG: hypothetical protein MJA27_11080 [Pseudanabaenales cyanobacterium]|nr:hypothetical protein [Pseudanabaenales cyanobacterium]